MTIDTRCSVCRNPDVRRGVELMWNGGMTQVAITRTVGDKLTVPAITKHLKEHSDGKPNSRQVDVEPELPARERVLALQRMQLDEVERQIALAQQKADMYNAALDKRIADGVEGAEFSPRHDWSEFFNLLGKDGQAALNTILKVTALEDRKALKTADLKLGMFEAMAKAGLAPKAISGGSSLPELPSGEVADED